METLAAQRCDLLLELGPAPVLSSLGQQCLGGEAATWCASLRSGRPDWEQILDALQSVYLRGVPIDWERFDQDYHRHKRDLPTYPFQRTRIWFRARPDFATVRRDESAHPLLGRRLPSPLPQAQFESRLSADSPGFIRDHDVGGVILLPGTAYLEMGLVAAKTLFGSRANRVVNVVFREAMTFGESETRTVQTIVEPSADGLASFRVQSLRSDGAQWTLHAEGQIALEPEAELTSPTPVASTPASARVIQPEEFYQTQRNRGYEFGPCFRGVQSITAVGGQAVGKVELPQDQEEAARYVVHPALMDACFQVAGATLPSTSLANLYLPISVRRFALWRPPGIRCTSQVNLRPGRGDSVHEVDLRIFDADGEVAAEIEGLAFQRVSATALSRISTRHLINEEYEIRWEAVPAASTGPPAAAELARRATARLGSLSVEHRVEQADALLTRLERLSGEWTEWILAEVGWNPVPGQTEAVSAIASQLGIVPRHARLFSRLLEIYAEDGGASVTDGRVTAHRKPRHREATRVLESLTQENPDSAELALLKGTVPGFPAALRGQCDPLQLLFPNGSTETAERLYTDSPMARLYNSLAADAFEAILQAAPADRPLRVLEIGGGTGGTTSHLLPRIGARPVSFTFTDLGDSFVMRARRKFAEFPGLQYRTLDIERSPAEQGLGESRFDVIIAANVLHATADMRRTVEHVRSLLADGGILLLLEITAPQRWFDLTVGLTEGWWKFADPDLRTRYTTLNAEQWNQLLGECGLEVATAIPEETATWSMQRQQLFIGKAADRTVEQKPDRAWLILEDRGGIGAQLAGALRGQGDRCAVAGPQGEDGLGASEAHSRLLREAKHLLGRFEVVDLRWLDTSEWGATIDTLDVLQPRVTDTLALVHAILHECPDAPPRLLTITRGAQAADGVTPLSPFQAAAWGMGRTMILEHPELRPILVDLDPGSDPDEIARLVGELRSEAPGAQVAFRDGERRVARLSRHVAPISSAEPRTESNTTLVASAPGLLENLKLVACDRPAPGPGEVEVEVETTSLNFRDVLNLLGLYPGDPGPLGGECGGRVTRLGPGVTGLTPGDRVVTTVPGAFSRFVVNRASLVFPIPPKLAMAEAAALPFAYLTAAYALRKLARLEEGETILIHAAAGGVGLAAVRLAQRTGAKIFATAGSPAKRAFLREIGIEHVLDSRSTGFADEILRLTGGKGVNVVLNSLSGNAIAASVRALAPRGRFVEIGKRGIWSAEEMSRTAPGIEFSILDIGDLLTNQPAELSGMVRELLREIETSALPTLPVTVFPMSRVADAFRHMMQARQIGKIVVDHEHNRPMSRIRPDATYLIVGGFSGLGLLAARWLADQGARHLALVGRRGMTAEAGSILAGLRQAGVTVHPAALDIGDEQGLAELLERLRGQAPPLRGILHAAGILDDGAILSQDWARFARVLGPKVAGARALDRLTASDPLDWFLIFSSAASLLGSAGQANHAAANAVLDVLAHERQRVGRPARQSTGAPGPASAPRPRRPCRPGWKSWAFAPSLRREDSLTSEP